MEPYARLESEVRSYCRHFPAVFQTARGSVMIDQDGRRFIDFLAGAGALNYGHNNAELKSAVIRYLQDDGPLSTLDLHTVAKGEFISLFDTAVLQPRALQYKLQFTSPSGTSVVESAVKLARKCTRRTNVVAFTNAYHGMSATSLALTGNSAYRQNATFQGVTRLPFDGYLGRQVDSLAYFRRMLSDSSSGLDLPAAVIVETIQAEGGINVAATDWLRELRALTTEFDIILIVDDIQVGCGRTGRFFSFEMAQISPDMVCLSKSLSGLGLPCAMLLLKEKFDRWQPGEDTGTFRGNNLAFVAGAAALRAYWLDDRLQQWVGKLECSFIEWGAGLMARYPTHIRDVRGRGLIHGIEFANPAAARSVSRKSFDLGLIIETCGSESQVIKILPPLTIDEATFAAGLRILENAIAEVLETRSIGGKTLATEMALGT